MDSSFIEGYEKIEKYFGYFPSFHDDTIGRIVITANQIDIIIQMESSPASIKQDSGEKIKLSFMNVKKFQLQGEMYGTISIIFELSFTKTPDFIEATLETSLGAEGFVLAERVTIELLSDN